TSKLNTLFDSYADSDNKNLIGTDGTIKLCNDLGVDPEDVVLLAVAYELKSPRMAEWERKGWVDGLKSLGALAFWNLLLPVGLHGGALKRVDKDGDLDMSGSGGGWSDRHTQLWIEFLSEKKVRGVSKDTWGM
ncbi:hypothetical protein MPER_15109, partial [Moniliophthora perniciosa FA553]